MTDKTVLLVDDSRVARMMARKVIADAHPSWTIVEAASGEEAVEAAPRVRPDFVVMDVNMPGIDGLEAARRLRSIVPDARITLLTANIQEPVRQQAAGIGVGFITKPIRDDALLTFLSGGTAA
ncbi:MAG: response regulator transcription factor [Pseudomonadota bacterium]